MWKHVGCCSLLLAMCVTFDYGPLPAQVATWRVAATPAIDLTGSGRAGEEFGQIVGVAQLSTGTLVVGQRQAPHLLFFDKSGKRTAAAGRTGGGPGEFTSLSWLQALGDDSLYLWDWQRRRVSVFGSNGSFARSLDLSTLQLPGPMSSPLAVLPDRHFLIATPHGIRFPFPGREGELRHDSTSLHAVNSKSERRWSIPPMASRSVFGLAYMQGTTRYLGGADAPFGAALAVAVLKDGVVFGTGNDPWLTLASNNGNKTRIPLSWTPRPLSGTDRTNLVSAVRACSTDGSAPPEAGQVTALFLKSLETSKAPFPKALPYHDRLLADPTGLIWVQDPSPVGLPQLCGANAPGSERWAVLNRDGRAVATVRLPIGLRALQVTLASVVGVWVDPDGAEHVRIHPLTRTP